MTDELVEIKTLLRDIAAVLPTLATKDDVARLEERLDTEIRQTRHDIEQTRHEAASSHFRIIGRIDELRDQMRAHTTDPRAHKPAAE